MNLRVPDVYAREQWLSMRNLHKLARKLRFSNFWSVMYYTKLESMQTVKRYLHSTRAVADHALASGKTRNARRGNVLWRAL